MTLKGLITTSRLTGLFYLGLAITGMFAFLFAKSNLYVEGNEIATLSNLISQQGLSRFGIAAELALVLFQVLTAIWFYKLFKKVDDFAAFALAIFGTINAIIILVSASFWLGAFTIAIGSSIPPTPIESSNTLLMFNIHEYLWVVGKLFFGLWLIPMGYLAVKSNMPKVLGWILILGGVGYILSLFLEILLPGPSSIAELITIPATIGEFWMIGYLLFGKSRF